MNRVLSLAVILAGALAAQADGPGLSLRIGDEAAPAGSIVQIKIEVTEPKPISTGRGKIKPRGVLNIEGIVLMNEGQDTYGVATIDEDGISFTATSPTGVFGTPADYPILGIAGTVAGGSNGTTFPLTLDPAGLGFRDPSGAVYPYEIQDGVLTIDSAAITIGDVNPGSALVPAGGVVRITGKNFTPQTRLDLHEVAVAQQQFVSSERIDLVLAQPARMHGMRIRARNDGKSGEKKSECEYFSYERTEAIGATIHPLFRRTVPLFAPASYTTAVVDVPRRVVRKQRAVRPARAAAAAQTPLAIALQNLQTSTATVAIELLDASGHPYAVSTVSIGPDQHFVRDVAEVFGIVSPPSAFRIRSGTPVQVLGITADAAGAAAALPPR